MAKKLTDLTTEEDKKTALNSTDRLADFDYFSYLDGHTAEETEEHQRMAEEIELNDRCESYLADEMMSKYREFIQAVNYSGINVENVFANIPTKTNIFRKIMGYDGLIGKNGKFVSFKDAKTSRIGRAFLRTYNTARKACNK